MEAYTKPACCGLSEFINLTERPPLPVRVEYYATRVFAALGLILDIHRMMINWRLDAQHFRLEQIPINTYKHVILVCTVLESHYGEKSTILTVGRTIY